MNIRETAIWLAVTALVTAVLLQFRADISGAHVALAYLLIVLGGSARAGRRLGFGLALLAFLAFNFFFIQPYHTFAIHHPLDYLVLIAFLAASAVATQLLHRAQAAADVSALRAREIDRLAAVGAEALNAPRAVDAVAAIAHVIRAGLHAAAAEIYIIEGDGGQAVRVARDPVAVDASESGGAPATLDGPAGEFALERAAAGLAVGETGDGTSYIAGNADSVASGELAFELDTRALLIPLRVRDRTIGVLRIQNHAGINLDVPQQRFAQALAYYAALALERVHLTTAAEHADALREADKLKDALLASVSHDLRTPLTTIKALAHDLAADGDERAVVIEEEADRLNRFVSDLLDLSRLNAGASALERELIAAEDVLGAALQRLSGAADGREIHASLDTAQPLIIGRFDFVHTLRALVNLIENAMKYSPRDGVVDVHVKREGEWVVFEVADRGPGIPPEERQRVFDPFIRGADSDDVSGAGLGLAIARQSIELQGGTIEYSARTGGGSVFSVRVPGADPADLERMSL